MLNTAKKTVRQLVSILEGYGVGEAVLSPGSRNAPLLVAMERQRSIATHVVVDERSAAFIALGMSWRKGCEPVAIVCTSGTAPLNYAPALAEAYYRNIPLIAVTADRPQQWIDQDDSQTIIQPGIFGNYIKMSVDIDSDNSNEAVQTMNIRKINDAMACALEHPRGPVHINVRLDEPLGLIADETVDIPSPVRQTLTMPSGEMLSLAPVGKNLMIVCGFMMPSNLSPLLKNLARHPSVVVLHEAQSNVKGDGEFITNIDGTLAQLEDAPAPDTVVTLGGALTSRKIKQYLRSLPKTTEHWSVSRRDITADCFCHLTMKIKSSEKAVLEALAKQLEGRDNGKDTEYKTIWREASRRAHALSQQFAQEAPWSDFKAMAYITRAIPKNTELHLSNGCSVRYIQLFDYSACSRIDCNRGVSGIDGCTSTAIGAAKVADRPVMLITGDMSMQYDIGALATSSIPSNFKIVVLNNGGGTIFRFIPSTRSLPELEKCFVVDVNLPLRGLAEAYGFEYFRVESQEELERDFERFVNCNSKPAILDVVTDGMVSAQVLKSFFEYKG